MEVSRIRLCIAVIEGVEQADGGSVWPGPRLNRIGFQVTDENHRLCGKRCCHGNRSIVVHRKLIDPKVAKRYSMNLED